MTIPDKTAPGPTAQTVVADALRSRILAGSPAPGTPLREEELADQYAVSRHTIRAALALLTAERIVETVPYRGSRVTDLDDDGVGALQDLRCALESAAIRLVHMRYGSDWPRTVLDPVQRALEALADAERANDQARVTASHVAFHLALVEAAGSPRILEGYQGIASEMLLLTSRVKDHYPAGSLAEQHREYLDHVRGGDAAVVWEHLRRSTEYMRQDRAETAAR